MLATRFSAVEASFIAKFDFKEKAALVHPILLTHLDRILFQRLIAPIPVIRHTGNIIEDLLIKSLPDAITVAEDAVVVIEDEDGELLTCGVALTVSVS